MPSGSLPPPPAGSRFRSDRKCCARKRPPRRLSRCSSTPGSRKPLQLRYGYRGTGVNRALDLIVSIVFVSVQWRITVILLRVAGRLFSGWQLTAARVTIFLFDAALLAGYAFT